MRKRRAQRAIFSLAALCIALVCCVAPAFANSGVPKRTEYGVDASGVLSVHEDSVLCVESETLTFNIGTPPYELAEGEEYAATVTAEYAFYNPTDEAVTTLMAFPFGSKPEYDTGDLTSSAIDSPIKINGEAAEYTIRHTYGSYCDFQKDVKEISDECVQSDFFTPELAVAAYTFTINVDTDSYVRCTAAMPGDASATKYICRSDYDTQFTYYGWNGKEITIYVLGEEEDISALDWSFSRYSSFFGRYVSCSGSMTCTGVERGNFSEYALRDWSEDTGISEIDWYNANFVYIDENETGFCPSYEYVLYAGGFMSWYVYSASVEAGGRFTNTVTAPLYPDVSLRYDPYVYTYNYYLSPAQGWASFKNLTVCINTDMYLLNEDYECSLYLGGEGVTATESGYKATYATLPEGELSFALCSEESPTYTGYSYNSSSYFSVSNVFTAVGLLLLIGSGYIAATVVWLVILVKNLKRK